MDLHSRTFRCLAAAGALLGATVPASGASADSVFHTARHAERAGRRTAVVRLRDRRPRERAAGARQERYHLMGALPPWTTR